MQGCSGSRSVPSSRTGSVTRGRTLPDVAALSLGMQLGEQLLFLLRRQPGAQLLGLVGRPRARPRARVRDRRRERPEFQSLLDAARVAHELRTGFLAFGGRPDG